MEASFHLNPRLRLKNLDPTKPQKQKAPVIANEGFAYLVARGGIDQGQVCLIKQKPVGHHLRLHKAFLLIEQLGFSIFNIR